MIDMRLRSRIGRIGAAAALGVLALGATATAASASTMQPAGGQGCFPWHDRNTYGVSCNDRSGYNAVARCKDGSKQYGRTVTRNHKSYAYCAGHRGLKYGWVAP